MILEFTGGCGLQFKVLSAGYSGYPICSSLKSIQHDMIAV